MRLRRLELRNFRRHVATRVELPDGVSALVGPNGAGKSSLIEGIAFALFGNDALRTPKALLRYDGAAPADPVEATLEMELAGHTVLVHRELKGKALTPAATLTIDGAVVVPGGANSSDAATGQIVKLLGLEPDAFFTTAIARQGELARLADQSPADRKRLILRMLGVDRLDAAIEKAREKRRETAAAVEAVRKVLPDPAALAATVEQARDDLARVGALAAAAEAAWSAAKASLAKVQENAQRIAQAAEERRDLAAKRDAMLRDVATLSELERQAAAAAAEAERAAAEVQGVAALAAAWPALHEQHHAAQQQAAAAKQRAAAKARVAALEADLASLHASSKALAAPSDARLAELEQRPLALQARLERAAAETHFGARRVAELGERERHLAHLGADAPCPTCERPLAGQHQLLLLQSQTSRSLGEAQRALAEATQAEASLRRDLDGARAEAAHGRKAVGDARLLDQRIAGATLRLAEAQATLGPDPGSLPDLDDLRRRLDEARRAHDRWQQAQGLANRLPALRAQASDAQARIARANAEAARLGADLAKRPAVDLDGARRHLLLEQANERQAERAATAARDADRSAARSLDAALARQAEAEGQRKALAAQEEELRDWCALTDGRAGLLERFRDHVVDRIGPAIQAEASRLLALFTGGRYTELLLGPGYEVYLGDDGQPRDLGRFSGGEQDLAHLALRLAVSRLLAERSGTELRFLALDEVFGSLDRQRRDLVVDALHGLSGLYAQVLVVSHQEMLTEALDQALSVELVEGESKVTLRNG